MQYILDVFGFFFEVFEAIQIFRLTFVVFLEKA